VKRQRATEKGPIRLKLLLCFCFTSVPLLTAQKTAPASSAPSSVEAFVDTTERLGVSSQYRASRTPGSTFLKPWELESHCSITTMTDAWTFIW